MLRVAIFILLVIVSSSVAIKRGGLPERLVAMTFLILIVTDAITHIFIKNGTLTITAAHFLMEIATWVFLVGIALRAHRIWTLFVASLQTLTVASYVVPFLELKIDPIVFPIMQVSASYPVLILMIIGTWRHQRRIGKFGIDPAWSR
jgi:hypothetical protein